VVTVLVRVPQPIADPVGTLLLDQRRPHQTADQLP
jgi:hypothetical protein